MTKKVRGKFHCHSITKHDNADGVTVEFTATDEAEWSQFTPDGSISIWVDNPAAEAQFVKGDVYYVDIIAVEADES
jgi:hypothetical protein